MSNELTNKPTDGARLCLKVILGKLQGSLKCCGHIEESPDWLCNMCPMHYNTYDLDDEESTECRIKDMEKHLDWIDNDFYLVVERNAEEGE